MGTPFVPVRRQAVNNHDLDEMFISINRYNGVYLNRNLRRALGDPQYVEFEVAGLEAIRLRAYGDNSTGVQWAADRSIRIPVTLRKHALDTLAGIVSRVVRIEGNQGHDGWWYFSLEGPKQHIRPLRSRRGS